MGRAPDQRANQIRFCELRTRTTVESTWTTCERKTTTWGTYPYTCIAHLTTWRQNTIWQSEHLNSWWTYLNNLWKKNYKVWRVPEQP